MWQLLFKTLSALLLSFAIFVDGHSEAEFGMSWCAGFGGSFYSSYFEVGPFVISSFSK